MSIIPVNTIYLHRRIAASMAAVAAILTPSIADAQLKESLEVEGTYNKEILYPDKLSRLPERRRLSTLESDVPYELSGTEANFYPSGVAIPATAYGANRTDIPPRGYLDLRLGSWLNASLQAGYEAISSEQRTLGIWLRHNSTSLWNPATADEAWSPAPMPDDYPDFKRFSYQEAIGARFSENFTGIGRLEAGVRYRLGWFNYYSAIPTLQPDGDWTKMPTQTLNDASFNVGFTSRRDLSSVNLWNANLAFRHVAFRTATRESSLRLDGAYTRRLAEGSDLGADASLQCLFYYAADDAKAVDNYGNLRLSPFYRWRSGMVTLRAGANLDFTFNADATTPDEHYALFHVSPDVRFDIYGNRATGWIHVTGGQELHTLASAVDANLYCLPELQSTTPVFSPLDARIGTSLKPFGGFNAEVELQYKITRNVAGEGWSMLLLRSNPLFGNIPLPQLHDPATAVATYGLGRERYNISGLSAAVRLAYTPAYWLDIKADGSYTPQNATTGVYNGPDRPRWILDAGFTVRPIKSLAIGVGYEYRGVRRIWSPMIAADTSTRAGGISQGSGTGTSGGGNTGAASSSPKADPASLRLPDITCLNADIEWQLPEMKGVKNVILGVHARNILGHNEIILPGLPSEGVTLSGSLQILF